MANKSMKIIFFRYCTPHLNGSLDGYRLLGWKFFSFGILKALLHCSLVFSVPFEKCKAILIPDILYTISFVPLEVCRILFFLSPVFWNFKIMYFSVGLYHQCVRHHGPFQSRNPCPFIVFKLFHWWLPSLWSFIFFYGKLPIQIWESPGLWLWFSYLFLFSPIALHEATKTKGQTFTIQGAPSKCK